MAFDDRFIFMRQSRSNWRNVRAPEGSLFDYLNRSFTSKSYVVPSFDGSSTLLIGSDYSGESGDEPYIVYSFLIAGNLSWASWEPRRLALRKTIFPDDRRMSYKKLGDGYRRQFLRPILEAADELDGISISLAINKSAPSIFPETVIFDPSNRDFDAFHNWKSSVREKAFTLLHLVGFLLAGLGKPGQDVIWFTDEDQIAANPAMLTSLTKALGWIASGYLDFDLGHLRCGTTSSDSGNRQIEDLVCIPDLVAGAISEQFRSSIANSIKDDKILWISGAGMKDKAQPIMFWLATRQIRLKKHVFVIDPTSDGGGHKVSWFNYGEGNPGSEERGGEPATGPESK